MTTLLRRAVALLALLALLVAAGCGGDDDGGSTEAGDGGGSAEVGAPVTETAADAQKGGELTVLSAGDVDYLDPGKAYYAFSFMVLYPMHMTLYAFEPGNPEAAAPMLADGEAEVSDDGLTVTVKIKDGVRFSPPVDREVTSADVKYAIERAFTKEVTNGYVNSYFANIKGVDAFKKGDADEISGIETPDDLTIVFNLTRGGPLVGALSMPITAPVPKEYAREFDSKNPSTYGENQVTTGPYMLDSYRPGREIVLTRNPNWDGELDPRPAYLDRIVFSEGNDDATVASRQILEGKGMVSGDFPPPPAVIKSTVQGDTKELIQFNPGSGTRWVSMDTTRPPFDDLNVRKAVLAGFDSNAMRLTRGGELIGDIATHMLYPGVSGFEEAGGMEGFGLDFLSNPSGDEELAAEYLRKAGFESGKYEGPPILMVGENAGVDQAAAQVAQRQFEKLGFKVNLRQVPGDTMYTKFCNVPSSDTQVCPNVGWIRDFADPETVLGPTFNGNNIVPENNVNWPELDDPAINKAMDEASGLTDPDERAQAWADIDRMITEQAPLIPWLWDKFPTIHSTDVQGVNALWNQGSYDLAYTSLAGAGS